MAHDNSAPDQEKKPGERPEGTFHFNPGNMAGKTIGAEQGTPDEKRDSQERQKPADHNSPK
jgi:hypothetical protein